MNARIVKMKTYKIKMALSDGSVLSDEIRAITPGHALDMFVIIQDLSDKRYESILITIKKS